MGTQITPFVAIAAGVVLTISIWLFQVGNV